jgi:hypothetical protein
VSDDVLGAFFMAEPATEITHHWTQRKVTGKRKVTVDAEKNDEKKIRRP